ncbi:ribonuclease Z [Lutibacter sp. B1]|uniref:ribonuclease Z n=1 Tax=Lutibacter sp. B1 TaxID=2725996 RepID=UPI0014572764|nr:ribonuclease Z [Lutibacter sp. B1]NLP58186.1 ribonuclease Z [Lutibacter sp. B1]
MSLKLTILGCHSATPRVNAHPTSQFLEIKNHHFLIDCGEGTQVQLRKYGVKFTKIKHIFISHLHGDHFFGLVGLISTFRLLNRKTELHIYAPKGLKEIITLQLKISNSWTNYPLIFHQLESNNSELIFEDEKVEVYTIPLNHRVYTNGFLFKEKVGARKLNTNAIKKFDEIDICDYQNIKNGKDFVLSNGLIIKNKELTIDPPKPLTYAYCSDTSFKPDITPVIFNVNCLYHESTFLKDKENLAESTKHTTAEQAANIAKLAQVKQLILGHFSSRYKDKEKFKEEAQEIFENTILAEEGKVYKIE